VAGSQDGGQAWRAPDCDAARGRCCCWLRGAQPGGMLQIQVPGSCSRGLAKLNALPLEALPPVLVAHARASCPLDPDLGKARKLLPSPHHLNCGRRPLTRTCRCRQRARRGWPPGARVPHPHCTPSRRAAATLAGLTRQRAHTLLQFGGVDDEGDGVGRHGWG
jgi:hypothetical protein